MNISNIQCFMSLLNKSIHHWKPFWFICLVTLSCSCRAVRELKYTVNSTALNRHQQLLHIRNHVEAMSINGESCGKAVAAGDSDGQIQKQKAKKKPRYICNSCGKEFPTPSNLKNPQSNSYWRKPLQLRKMWQRIYPKRQPPIASQNTAHLTQLTHFLDKIDFSIKAFS